ncbi:MAG: winged helix-turn-helix domain-containing protein [Pyrodictiaceae archaeon]
MTRPASSEALLILGSKGKLKILLFLSRVIESNITRITRETGLHHSSVSRHLRELVEMGIVEERVIGRAKIYSLNYSNPKTLMILEVLRSLSNES